MTVAWREVGCSCMALHEHEAVHVRHVHVGEDELIGFALGVSRFEIFDRGFAPGATSGSMPQPRSRPSRMRRLVLLSSTIRTLVPAQHL